MNKQLFSLTIFIIVGLVSMIIWQKAKFSDGKLHVVFCDVGQGDAIFIRTPGKTDIILDGGPDRKVLDCLANHMPFWDRTIELMLLSHPHQDHFAGLIDVFQNYTVLAFATEKLGNDTAGYGEFHRALQKENVGIRYLFAGDTIRTNDGVTLTVLSPTKTFLDQTSPDGLIDEAEGFGTLILLLSYGQFSVLLTSDGQVTQLAGVSERPVDILQVPHHGSRFGINKDIVARLDPQLAVISVGKNRYGHPTEEVIKILRDYDITILRTDEHGEIEIVSDGKSLLLHPGGVTEVTH